MSESKIEGMLLGGTVSKSPKSLSLSINILPKKGFEIPSRLDFLGFTLRLISYSKASNGTYSLSYSSAIREDRFTTGRIYKTVPRPLYEAYKMTCQISRIYPLVEPESTLVRLKLAEDPYGADGFLLSEILEDLELRVELPPIFNYKIVEFVVRKGASKEQIVKSLIALPVVINYISEDTFEVNPNSAFSYLPGSCESFAVEDIQHFEYFTTGVLGEPIKTAIESNCDGDGITFIYNRFGSVYGIVREEFDGTFKIEPFRPTSS